MKITIKTLQQKIFQIDIDPTESIGALKVKIQAEHGHAVANQKIVYSGKILSDDKTVESCNVKEKDFFVLMTTKPKPKSATETASTTPTVSASVPNAPPTEAPVAPPPAAPPAPAVAAPSSAPTQPPAQQPPAATATPSSTATTAFGDQSSFLSGEALQTTITSMTEMGFPRDQVLRALRASFNNPDRAVEYLMNGIPAHLEAEAAGSAQTSTPSPAAPAAPVSTAAAAAPQSAPTSAPQAGSTTGAPPANQPQNLFQLAQQQQQQQHTGTRAGAGAAPQLSLEALRDNPQIQQLRQLVEQNPGLVQPLIQQLAQANPGLAQVLAQSPDALSQLLGVPPLGDPDDESASGAIPPGAQVISVTPEERAAIERLEALGFPRQAVIEAYFACDKNEELAANFLFEGAFDDDN